MCPSCGRLVGVNDERCYNCGRWNPGLWGYAPMLRRFGSDFGFVSFVIGACGVVYVLTLLATVALGGTIRMNGIFDLLGPSGQALFVFGAAGSTPVLRFGRWWTVLSASWLHGSFLHILFNMLWVRDLAPGVADIYGAGRMIIIYTVAGVCGFALSSVAPPLPILGGGAGLTLGASASVFGLLGALVHYGRRGGSSHIHRQALYYAVIMFVFGVMMPGVDNWAHAGGFAGGYVASLVLDPLRPERLEHLIGALVCLALVVLSILVSIVTGLALLRY